MRVRQITGNIVKLAILGACVYAAMKWQAGESQDSGLKAFAESACVDEIGSRYKVSTVRVYELRENSNGFTVRASATLARGAPVKIVCLTNPHGGVREVTIDER